MPVVRFVSSLLTEGDGRPTVIALDNASPHHGIGGHTRALVDRSEDDPTVTSNPIARDST